MPLKDKDKQVWKYAIDALAGRFTRESPGQALSILRDYVLHAKGDDRETEAWYDINSIRGMARDGNYDVKTRMAGFLGHWRKSPSTQMTQISAGMLFWNWR